MKCKYCNQPSGFLKSYHSECHNHIKTRESEISTLIEQLHIDIKSVQSVKLRLKEIASEDNLYINHMKNSNFNSEHVQENENIIYCENWITITESKNRPKMVRTGYRYEKKPVWKVANYKLGDNLTILFTDKSLYLISDQISLRYTYNKILNINCDERWTYTYFDVKTTSPYPHRFYIKSNNRINKNVYLLIKCFTS